MFLRDFMGASVEDSRAPLEDADLNVLLTDSLDDFLDYGSSILLQVW